LAALLLILAAATSATAANRHRPATRPLTIGDRVREKDNVFGPTWYVINQWESDLLVDNGVDQEYKSVSEVVLDNE
jgi:hypothetical protein